MIKAITLLVALLCCVSAFTIEQQNTNLEAIPWPFTICGKGAWKIESLTLGSQPKRDATDDIDVVNDV